MNFFHLFFSFLRFIRNKSSNDKKNSVKSVTGKKLMMINYVNL